MLKLLMNKGKERVIIFRSMAELNKNLYKIVI